MTVVVGIAEAPESSASWSDALAAGVQAAATIGGIPTLRVVSIADVLGPLPDPSETFVQRMLHELGSANPALRELARELHAYLTGASTAVLERVKAAVQPDTTVLVGHGLGAVVAYDLLRRDSLGQQIKVLVTLGAPLGLAAVRTALNVPEPLVPPDGVLWMNVLDPDDVRTGGEGLADLGPGITDGYVDNGDRASAATAYLAQGQTGRAILNGV